ncbi:hypothetical protein AURDEDRAFT_176576 [Auricularia subglabra TFB-10046 SS5]|uniref:Uncharacterized protein n=1 Tax=Auricularia subglabra (strain TFB-10046 / SS5) TaxID=717982 RepID=J0WPL9_AURST|nr:hypothetical protein AURDEDRAFT_176576 [Auricularia subglabra TFB-10046 SS5]
MDGKMLSTSDHHHAPAKRGRSPPAEPEAGNVFKANAVATSHTAKKTKTSAEAPVAKENNLSPVFYTWGEPPLTPSRRKASTILTSKLACRDLIDDIGRKLWREGGVDTTPQDLDELQALGLAAYRLYMLARDIMNRLPDYDRRYCVTLPTSLQTSREVQMDDIPTTSTPVPTPPGAGTSDRAPPERSRTTPTVDLAAPERRDPVKPLRAAQGMHRITHKPPVKGRPPRSAPPPRASPQARGGPRSQPVARVIVRYGNTGTLRDRPRPHTASLRHTLNGVLGGEWIAGISYSRVGQLALHAKAPFTAQQLALRGDALRPVIRAAFGLAGDPRPIFETDAIWSKVVIHRIPLPPSGDSMEAMDVKLQAFFADVCSSNGFDSRLVRRMQLLCPKGKEEEHFRQSTDLSPRHLSVMLCIADDKLVGRLIRNGAFWQGAHCRISNYRPRNNG